MTFLDSLENDLDLAWKVLRNRALIWQVKDDAVALVGTEQAQKLIKDATALAQKWHGPTKAPAPAPSSDPATAPATSHAELQKEYDEQMQFLRMYGLTRYLPAGEQ
ncbi:MAG: hypothetical protein KGL39_07480 [Patescibacteria group bacterium]|nr:hypothetical protein [Patescibacteria group bacterium]